MAKKKIQTYTTTPHTGQADIITKMYAADCFYNIFNCSRQFGKTFLLLQLMLADGCNNPGSKLIYCSPIFAQAKKQYTDTYNLIVGSSLLKEHNKTDLFLKFSNGSELRFLGVENYDGIRGNSCNYLYCDEFQFWHPNAWENVVKQFVVTIGKKVYIASTPRAKGSLFHQMYEKGSNNEPRYFSITHNYMSNPLANLEEVEDARQSLPALIFKCEYLAEFINSGSEVFQNIDKIAKIDSWRMPKRGEQCYAGLDIARQRDWTVLTITNQFGEVLYIYRKQKTSWEDIVHQIVYHLKRYGVKKCLVETNGIGDVVYEMLIKEGAKGILIPFTTTSDSKQDIIERLISKIEKGLIMIPSKKLFPALYSELSTFSYDYNPRSRKVKYQAAGSAHDDTVMSLAFCSHISESLTNYTPPAFRTINQESTSLNNQEEWGHSSAGTLFD